VSLAGAPRGRHNAGMKNSARWPVAATLAGILIAQTPPVPGNAQTAPSPLAPGPNSGSADSFVGAHVWYFNATPGRFTVEVDATGTSSDSAPIGGAFNASAAFASYVKGDALALSQIPHGIVIHGTAVRPTRVLVTITPPNSPLVRVARNYMIQAGGNVAYSASDADPITGTYISKRNSYGATRFTPKGAVLTSDGQQGRWVLFNPSLHIYTVLIGADRMTVKFMAGRGLVDASNDNVYFEQAR
jgi:hypothetical protein